MHSCHLKFVLLAFLLFGLPTSALAHDESQSTCSGDELLAWLRDDEHYERCEQDDFSCLRLTGDRLTQQCVSIRLPECKGAVSQSNPLWIRVLQPCEIEQTAIADQLANEIVAALPSSDIIRKIPNLSFTEEGRLAHEIDNIEIRSWPIGCSSTLSPSEPLETELCRNVEAMRRLGNVGAVAAILSANIEDF